jgi:3-phenylpropionate/trans-cinnamate dioxygenase ferredoxin reductase component
VADYKYLIVGGGMTADSATKGIRELDPTGTIGLISDESEPPYDRPPLSKKLWFGKPFEIIWRKTGTRNVTMHLGRRVDSLNPARKEVVDDQGHAYHYEKLLLATGGTPRRLAFGGDRVIHFRTVADYRRLRALTETKQSFAVIGGGFIGSEIAAALAANGKQVILVMPDTGICARVFPADLSRFVTEHFANKGVEIKAGESVVGIRPLGEGSVLQLKSGAEIGVDAVIAGIGIVPSIELAQQAGLKTGNGIVVDEYLRASDPDILAAGDVAEFYNPLLDRRMRAEHEDNANKMGKHAGRAMAGATEPYHHLPFFYSDLFELGYEAVGDLDSRLETIADWREPFRRGVIFYMLNGRVRGVMLWNVWEKVPAARELIAQPGPFAAQDLVGRWLA